MEASAECPESASAAGEETGLEETDTRSEETAELARYDGYR